MRKNILLQRCLAVLLLLAACSGSLKAQVDYTIGTGTTVNSCTGNPSPFYDYFKSNRHQFLYTAAEMTAAGMGAGVITAVKYEVVTPCNVAPLQNFEIKMGATTTTSLTGAFVTGLTSIAGPSTYTRTTGINTFTLSTPFFWNGTDNIVIETCHDNTSLPNYTENAGVRFTSTTYNSTVNAVSDFSNQCPSTTGSTLTQRPNVIFTYGIPCNGIPTTEVTGPTEICPNVRFNLSFTTFYAGITVNWQKSTDGRTWSNFTGNVNAAGILRDSIIVNTYYRAIIKCNSSGLTYTTQPFLVSISAFYYCYCDNQSTFATNDNRVNIGEVKITGVPMGDTRLSNKTITTGNTTNNANASKNYSDFRRSLPPVKMYRDSSFRIELHQFNSLNALTSSSAIAYLDYDRNGVFDEYERLFLENSHDQAIPGVIIDTFKVSDTAYIGLTGLRIIIKNGNTFPDSCGNYANGETEDYLADIRYEPCKGPVNGGLAFASDTSSCPDYKYWVIDSTYERKRSEVSKRWQFSADNIVWHNVPNSSKQDTLARIFYNNQPFYYRMQMKCDATGDSSYSNTVRVNKKPGYKCYCFSQAIGNDNDMGLDSSDAGGLQVANFNLNQGGSHLLNPGAWHPRKDFTDLQPIELYVDTTYQFDVYHIMPNGHHGDAKVTLFIDFNNNHQYDIPEDRVYTGFTSVGTFQLTPRIYIPNDAIVNVPTGMRLIINNNMAPNASSDSACGTYISGETEDYMITFRRRFPLSVANSSLIKGMQVYPNPSSGKFTVEFTSEAAVKDVKVQVTNVTGQKVFEQGYEQFKGKFSQQIDLNGTAPGIYFIELHADGQKQIQRISIR